MPQPTSPQNTASLSQNFWGEFLHVPVGSLEHQDQTFSNDYLSSLLEPTNPRPLNQLHQTHCLVFNQPNRTPVAPLLMLTVVIHIKFKTLKLTYKSVSEITPPTSNSTLHLKWCKSLTILWPSLSPDLNPIGYKPQNTNWGNVFWENGVHNSSTVPETSNDTELSRPSLWPNILVTHSLTH